ncbi:uncharacterized protein F5Z01DRAFT_640329 [Emericellopsis atlantica]|uniref:Uncharacterized protein n=1 Tax=Emericellopsis atlantica TaxID=2614577 RepID=A0A9P7ZEL7_9HYPO|nr:uncharacterized protein F5Z01DRAFT_640329 [Emericellopsis atlantica]KAG9250311.1 hypothetical protein F5Z01DRAFT_640329 [Emericellopsis atlantica]
MALHQIFRIRRVTRRPQDAQPDGAGLSTSQGRKYMGDYQCQYAVPVEAPQKRRAGGAQEEWWQVEELEGWLGNWGVIFVVVVVLVVFTANISPYLPYMHLVHLYR